MSERSEHARLEAFCDGVFAIAITLLVLDIKVPLLDTVHSTKELVEHLFADWPSWFGFLLSFVIIFVAWINHHNAFKMINKTSAAFIYANGFLLLTVVAMPFTTELMAEYLRTDYAQPAVSAYCFTLLIHNISWIVLGWTILRPDLTKDEESRSLMMNMVGKYPRRVFFLYLSISILSFWFPVTAVVLMSASWIIWIVTGIISNPGKR